MKFQKKIIFVYMIFSLLITGIFSVGYYHQSVSRYMEREYGSIRTVSNVKLQQMENVLESMESAITYVLSDVGVLESIRRLTMLETDSYEEVYFDEAVANIRSRLNSYYLMEKFYRIVFFNKAGVTIANNNYTDVAMNVNASYATYPWVDKVSGKNGKDVVIKVHQDDWGGRRQPQVLSVVKEIQGLDLGYMEVQKEKAELDKMLDNKEDEVTYLFYTAEGEFLYSDADEIDYQYYWNHKQDYMKDVCRIKTENGENALALIQYSEEQDLILVTVARVDIGKCAMEEVLPVSLLLLFGAILLSLGYILITSRQLTRPIQQLQKFMETTGLDNMEAEIPEKISNDEIEALYISYKDVLNRLHASILKEKQISLLSLQAQFDLLQAQVNPHFIYNVLNVISNRGMVADDEVVCEICSDLAGMLRYSTNTKDKYATVCQEVEYLELYLRLLKHRYDYKLSYRIDVDQELYACTLPKLVLQQIVENAVNHGYQGSTDVIRVEISGGKAEDGWFLKIHDEGQGITREKLEEIYQKFESVKKKLTVSRGNVELQIGGMGLVNTYARLYLYYNESVRFEILPAEGKGTDVIINVTGERVEKDV